MPKIYPLSNNEGAGTSYRMKIRMDSSDWSDADTAQTVDLIVLPVGHVVRGVAYKVAEDLTGTSLSNVTMSLGVSGATTTWFNAADINQTSVATYGISNTALAFNAANTVQATVTTTGANLSALTAGIVDIFIDVADLALDL